VFSVTSDLAASAPYSSAPPKFAPPDPSQANDNFAALVDSNNTQADTASSLPPAPEPAAPQRSSNDSSQTSANRPSSDAGPANPAPPPANSNNTTDSATQAADSNAAAAGANGKSNAGQPSSAKSGSTSSGGGKSTDKASTDKSSANSGDPATVPQQGGTQIAIPNAIATVIPVTAALADTPATASPASNPNAPLAIAAAAIAASSSTAAALTAPAAPVKANSASATGTTANGPTANAKAAVQTAIATPTKTQATPIDAAPANEAALATSAGTPNPIGAKTTAANTQVTAPAKGTGPSAPGTAAATSDPSTTAAGTDNGNVAPQPATGGKPDGATPLAEGVKADGSNGAPATGAATPSSHDRPAIAAAGQVTSAAPDASAQAAAALPQQLSSSATVASTNTLTAAPATGGAVPVSGLAVEIAASVQGGKTHFEIRLDPAELGRIDVRIDVDRNGQVTSHLTVEKPETLSMLRQDAPQLQQALNDAGLKSGSGGLQFSLRDQSSSGQNGGNQSGGNAQRLIVNNENAAPSVAAGQSYGRLLGSSGGIDIRV
jgi:flagellar hook-length control protein FliK